MITVKAGTASETRVRGFLFKFSLKAAKELLKIVYETGAGEKGSSGFGMVGVI
ncbi:MAG: hypothetical protein LBO71_03650 [Prevotellaceae bacterium]|nr:hypothetical protein [Prevotellaceae bacterium]